MNLPRKHMYSPVLSSDETKHFAKWSRAELIAHLLYYYSDDRLGREDLRNTYTSKGACDLAARQLTTTFLHYCMASRSTLFARCIDLEVQRDSTIEKSNPTSTADKQRLEDVTAHRDDLKERLGKALDANTELQDAIVALGLMLGSLHKRIKGE